MSARALKLVLLSLVAALTAAGAAHARDAARFTPSVEDGYGRLVVAWPEGLSPTATADLDHGVLVVRFSRAVTADPRDLPGSLGGRVALARLDPDGGALRLALRADVRAHLSWSDNLLAVDLVDAARAEDPADIMSPSEAARLAAQAEARARAEAAASAAASAPVAPPALPLGVRIARASEYTRIAFDWTEHVGYEVAERDGGAVVRFDRDASPDLSRLRVDPPQGVETAEASHDDDRLAVSLALTPGYETRHWRDGDRIIIDVIPQTSFALEAALDALDARDAAHEAEAARSPPAPISVVAEHAEEHAPEAEHVAEHAPEAAAEPAPEPAPAPEHAAEPAAEPSQAPPPHDAPNAHVVEHDDILGHEPALAPPSEVLPHDETAPSEPAEPEDDHDAHDPAPQPSDGRVLRAQVTPSGREIHIEFAWGEPVGAAVFRRGDVWWIVFDRAVGLHVGEIRRGGGHLLRAVQTVEGDDFVAARLVTRPEAQLSAHEADGRWRFTLSEAVDAMPAPYDVDRAGEAGEPFRLVARLARARSVLRVPDPEVGDTLIVATSSSPAEGLPAPRRFMEAAALATAHGAAFEVYADDIDARIVADGVELFRPGGLALTPPSYVTAGPAASSRAPIATSMPAFVDFVGWSGPEHAYVERQNRLELDAAMADEPAEALMRLAQFHIAHELAPETLGSVALVLDAAPEYVNDPRLRALRGAASLMMGRLADARRDFSAPTLADDPSASLWRALLSAEEEDWRAARREFEAGREALIFFRPDWRARFRLAAAEAALELGDLATAGALIAEALAEAPPRPVALEARFLEARRRIAAGDEEGALAMARRVANSGYEPLETRAMHLLVEADQRHGALTAAEAVQELETLRLRWRGDRAEIDIARGLGRLYTEAGDYRAGLGLMRVVATRFPDHPVARAIHTDMLDIFSRLYLDGDADEMDPVTALALWYEFSDLTPAGPDGDRMIRRLADRLVDFDLLPQAAELLQHQVDNRLLGVARAQVATDLAAVYLLDRRAEDALNAIRSTRIAQLPRALNDERRLLEARALAEVGREDHALELLFTDRTPEARRLRADIAWESRDWTQAGELLEAALGESWRDPGPLAPDVEASVLRAGIAYALAGESEAVGRLDARYGRRMAAGADAAAWRLVARGQADTDGVRLRDLARRIAETDTLDAFLEDFRARRAVAAASGDDAAGDEAAEG